MSENPKDFNLRKVLMDSPYGKLYRLSFPLMMNLPVILLKPVIGYVALMMIEESNAQTNLLIDAFLFLSGWFYWVYLPVSLAICYWLSFRFRNLWVSFFIFLYASAITIGLVISFFMSYVAMLYAL